LVTENLIERYNSQAKLLYALAGYVPISSNFC